VLFQYVIGDSDLKRVDVINVLDILVDNRMTFVNHTKSLLEVLNDRRKVAFALFVRDILCRRIESSVYKESFFFENKS
jgi:hypothetical protein